MDKAVARAGRNADRLEEILCSLFVKPICSELLREGIPSECIAVRLGSKAPQKIITPNVVFVDIGLVQTNPSEWRKGADQNAQRNGDDHLGSSKYDATNLLSKNFVYRKPPSATEVISSTFVEITVATPFPCPLSRQHSLLSSQFVSNK